MRKLLTLTAAAALVAAFGFAAGPASAQSFQRANCSGEGNCIVIKGAKLQSDHALYNRGPDTAIYCGVELNQFVEPWTLHLSATADANGTVTIRFNDNDSITFNLLAGTTFSTTQAFGGVGGVTGPSVSDFGSDDLVKITGNAGIVAMLASAEVRAQATDPFVETDGEGPGSGDDEPDNFCITAPGDPGADWAAAHFPEHAD